MVPIAAGGSYEFVDAPAGLSLDEVADGHRGEHDRHVGFDRFALVVGEGRSFRSSAVIFGRSQQSRVIHVLSR